MSFTCKEEGCARSFVTAAARNGHAAWHKAEKRPRQSVEMSAEMSAALISPTALAVSTIQLIAELVEAAEMGECPRTDCPMCLKKFAAIKRGKEFLELLKGFR